MERPAKPKSAKILEFPGATSESRHIKKNTKPPESSPSEIVSLDNAREVAKDILAESEKQIPGVELEGMTVAAVREYIADSVATEDTAKDAPPTAKKERAKKPRSKPPEETVSAAPTEQTKFDNAVREQKVKRARESRIRAESPDLKLVDITPKESDTLSPEEQEDKKNADIHERARRRMKNAETEFAKEKQTTNEQLEQQQRTQLEDADKATKIAEMNTLAENAHPFKFDKNIQMMDPEQVSACIRNLQHALDEAEYGWVLRSVLTTPPTHVLLYEVGDHLDFSIQKPDGAAASIDLPVRLSSTAEELKELVDDAGKAVVDVTTSEKGYALRVNALTGFLQDRFKVHILSRPSNNAPKIATFLENLHGAIRSLSSTEQAQLENMNIYTPENNGFPLIRIFKSMGMIPYNARIDTDGDLRADFDTPTERLEIGLRKLIAKKSSQQ